MQNKGFIRFFAVAFALVCLFYLSFNAITSHFDDEAINYSNGDKAAEYAYLDSMASEEVWLGYTLKECRENELNLGLDLKGGMNVILEISVPDIVRTLASESKDETFNKVMELAIAKQTSSQADFIDLFQDTYNEVDPEARLSVIFIGSLGPRSGAESSLQLSSTNDEVIEALKAEVQATVDNSFNVLRTRIDRFGVVQPNIQRLETNGRILVELPGVKEPERVRKLLQGSANLEFWETYNYNEISSDLAEANKIIREMQPQEEQVKEEVVVEEALVEVPVVDSLAATGVDSLAAILAETAVVEQDSAKMIADYKIENPLFSILMPSGYDGPVVGTVNVRDTAKVTEYLNLPQVKEILRRDLSFRWTVKPVDEKGLFYQLVAIKVTNRNGKAPLEGNVITDAYSDLSSMSANSTVSMAMNPEGAKTWARLTRDNKGRSIAIALDGMIYSFPNVNAEITGGRSEISGNFTPEEAKDLANVLKSGKMPAPARIVQEDVVGPSLGQEAINSGMLSFLISFIVIMAYMVMMYGVKPGLIVDGALIVNMLFLVGVLASFKAVLTLPGIAGIVLTIGMAVDANVLIYERIKEELAAGKSHKAAISDGYSNAMSAIIDANISTLLTGIILFYFGTGPIKGFASTLIIGIITSFFTVVFLTRLVYERMGESGSINNISFTTAISENLFKKVHVNWMKVRKYGYLISAIALVTVSISLATRGLNEGIDFSGGRNYVVRFEEEVNTAEINDLILEGMPGASVSVITIGGSDQVRISTNYRIADNGNNVDEEIENIIFTQLKPEFPEGLTKSLFLSGYIETDGVSSKPFDDTLPTYGVQSSQKVGPAIADDIKNDAFLAVLFSMIAVFIYILARFRNVSYSVGAVAALIHDTVMVLGLYSLLYSIMPFSMEMDQAFIAAILTVIGYSLNDTVVIFDRVRELIGLHPKSPRADIINEALNATLVRTFSTSFSTFLVLITIFLLGGDTIRGMVFALLIGVVVGTYSSLFIAVPVSYDMDKKKLEEASAKKKR